MGLQIRAEIEDGHTVEIHGNNEFLKWRPLGLSAFRASILEGKEIPLAISQATMVSSGPEHNFSGVAEVELPLRPAFPIRVFGLVPGGWLPAAFCESTLLLPDANLAGSFSSLDDEASRLRAQTILDDVPLMSMGANRISAAFAAFECGDGRFPSHSQYADRFKALSTRLQRGFPDRQVVVPNHDTIRSAYDGFLKTFFGYKRSEAYLHKAFPLISHKVADAKLAATHEILDGIADKFGVSHVSFIHLLVLDCLYDNGPLKKSQQNPGRLVLKPKKTFSSVDLHNALSDVMYMEKLCMLHLSASAEQPVFCTRDHGLTQAWAMLRPNPVRLFGGEFSIDIQLEDGFASRLQGDMRQAFFERLLRSKASSSSTLARRAWQMTSQASPILLPNGPTKLSPPPASEA